MFRIFSSLFNNPRRDAKRLNRDAPAIIDSATKSFAADRVREIALQTLQHVGEANVHFEEHSESYDQVLYRFQQLHSESRRRMDQVGLTVFTLVIIYLRATALGGIADPAREAIDEFTGSWALAAEE